VPWPENPQDHTIFALAGNVSEWTADAFAPYAPPEGGRTCWVPDGAPVLDHVDWTGEEWCPFTDPESETISVRGGSWRDPVAGTWSASRNAMAAEPPTPRPEIGFRCVRDLVER